MVLNGRDAIHEALVERATDFADRVPSYADTHVWNKRLCGLDSIFLSYRTDGKGRADEIGFEGKLERKRWPCRKRVDIINDLLEKEWYGDLKRRAEDRQEWRVWLPGTCRMAEH